MLYTGQQKLEKAETIQGSFLLTTKDPEGEIDQTKIFVNGEYYGKTDENGKIEIKLSQGTYKLKATRTGKVNSKEYTITIEEKPEEKNPILIPLIAGIIILIIIIALFGYKQHRK